MIFELLVSTNVRHETNIREIVFDILKTTLDANGNEFDDDSVDRMISLSHARMGNQITDENGNNSTPAIVGVVLDIPDETAQLEVIIDEFIGGLTGEPHQFHVIKFEDPLLHVQLQERAREIFALEMKLRRVLSLVYLHAYQNGDPYDLLGEESVKPMNPPHADQMRAAAENEFFHLTFSQYVNLNRRPEVKLRDILDAIREFEQYELFRTELLRSPVEHEDDTVLLAGLRQRMESIEAMRNCIAHNRRPGRRVVENYENARPLLDQLLDAYLETWEIVEDRDIDHEMHWETAAREAVQHAMENAVWNGLEHTITFEENNEPPQSTTVANLEELEAYLGEIASSAFYENSPWENGESVFECDEAEFVHPVLEQYHQQLDELFRELGTDEQNDDISNR